MAGPRVDRKGECVLGFVLGLSQNCTCRASPSARQWFAKNHFPSMSFWNRGFLRSGSKFAGPVDVYYGNPGYLPAKVLSGLNSQISGRWSCEFQRTRVSPSGDAEIRRGVKPELE